MYKRKIEDQMEEWLQNNSIQKKALLLKGARHVGKTTLALSFARKHYESVVYLDLRKDKRIRNAFSNDFNIDFIMMQISAAISNIKLIPGKTVIIMDEIQDCPNARSSLKYFCLDGRYDVICTGSLLSIKGYASNAGRGVPVGFEYHLLMKPMDFEEFLWAMGTDETVLGHLKESFDNRTPVLPVIHQRMHELFRQYMVVGGMPEAVKSFVTKNNLSFVLGTQKNIIESYKDDFGRHLQNDGTEYVNQSELARILACFVSIPVQLAKDNKKFMFSKVNYRPGSRSVDYHGAIQWLCDAGICTQCFNLEEPSLPLDGNKKPDNFKLYMQDSGLFISMLEEGTASSIISGDLGAYKGAIYENILADTFSKMGRSLYFYRKESGMEIDFVTRYNGHATPVEVKATSGKAKALNTLMKRKDDYDIQHAIKLSALNIAEQDDILYMPYYLGYMLTQY